MSLIVSEVYDALIEAGATKEKARAAAGAVPFAEGLATREDIAKLQAANREDIAKLEAATRERFAKLETATTERFIRLETATTERFAKLDKDIAVLKLAVFTFEPAVVVLLVKLIFFP